MYYALISLAALLFSFQFVVNDGFRRQNGNSWNASLRFTLYSAVAGFVILIFVNKFRMEYTHFSLVLALLYSLVCIVLGYCNIMAFSYANLSVYSVFCMIGGMALPFIYGVFTGEDVTYAKVICFLLIALSVGLSVNPGKHSPKAIFYYLAVFVLNGAVGVISAWHQSNSALCVDSGSFMMLTKIWSVLLSGILILLSRDKNFKINFKSAICCTGYSALNSIGNLWLLVALLHLPASIQYPIVTGGTIIFATLISICRGEKVTGREIAASVIAFTSAVCMAL